MQILVRALSSDLSLLMCYFSCLILISFFHFCACPHRCIHLRKQVSGQNTCLQSSSISTHRMGTQKVFDMVIFLTTVNTYCLSSKNHMHGNEFLPCARQSSQCFMCIKLPNPITILQLTLLLPQFTNEETKFHKSSVLSKWQSWVTKPESVAPGSLFLASNYVAPLLA